MVNVNAVDASIFPKNAIPGSYDQDLDNVN